MKTLCIMVLLTFTSSSQAESLHARLRPPLAGAHRGGTYNLSAGPNTLAQFEQARADGIDVIEMDLRLTRDGVVVVYHDEDLKEQGSCKGPVKDTLYQDFAKCRKSWYGNPLPSFEEVLQWDAGTILLTPEFKVAEVIGPAIELVRKYAAHDWVYFQVNTSQEKYHQVRAIDPQIALNYKPTNLEDLNWALSLIDPYLVVIELFTPLRTAEVIRSIHQAGKLATSNSWQESSIREFFGASCDTIFKKGVDIAISEQTKSCVQQALKRRK